MSRPSFREKMASIIFEATYEVRVTTTPHLLAIAQKPAPAVESERYVKASGRPLLMPAWSGAYLLFHHETTSMIHAYDELEAISGANSELSKRLV